MRLLLPVLTTLLSLAAGPALAQPKQPDSSLRVYVPPPLEWNLRTQVTKSGLSQTPYDLARLNGDVTFGMTPEQVVAAIPGLPPDLNWNSLRTAREYPGDVRFFWLRLDDMPPWRKLMHGCTGSASYAAFQFNRGRLFRISFRLIPDSECPAVTAPALDLFGHFAGIDPTIALAVHYRSQQAEVVDLTDPVQAALVPIRWRMSGP